MTDTLTKKHRSYNMSRIKATNTTPEVKLRKELISRGCRSYRLHYDLPGKPDLFFPRYGVAVFIDGCFWHKCPKCFIEPRTNARFWAKKIQGNVERDKRINNALKRRGYLVLRFWEHELSRNRTPQLALKILRALKSRGYRRGNKDS